MFASLSKTPWASKLASLVPWPKRHGAKLFYVRTPDLFFYYYFQFWRYCMIRTNNLRQDGRGHAESEKHECGGKRTACCHSRQLPLHHSEHMVGAEIWHEQMDVRSAAGSGCERLVRSHAHLTTSSGAPASPPRGSAPSETPRRRVQDDQHGAASSPQQPEQEWLSGYAALCCRNRIKKGSRWYLCCSGHWLLCFQSHSAVIPKWLIVELNLVDSQFCCKVGQKKNNFLVLMWKFLITSYFMNIKYRKLLMALNWSYEQRLSTKAGHERN